MKYYSKLNHHQNLLAWKQHSMRINGTDYNSLNEVEKNWLRGLNDFLLKIEKEFYPIMATKDRELTARVDYQSDWMTEFNLERVITFYLRKDDSEYEEDDDNVLIQIYDIFIEGEDFDVDCSESRFSGEKHCYLYHQLYDHFHLDWRDLLRIGSLYVEIMIDEQSDMLQLSPISEFITRG